MIRFEGWYLRQREVVEVAPQTDLVRVLPLQKGLED